MVAICLVPSLLVDVLSPDGWMVTLEFEVGKVGDRYSYTHEVFLYTSQDLMDRIFENSIRFGITLNKKHKKLFQGYGIRLGTQEIARYGWTTESMKQVAQIIFEISQENVNENKVQQLLAGLPQKRIQYTFDDATKAYFNRFV